MITLLSSVGIAAEVVLLRSFLSSMLDPSRDQRVGVIVFLLVTMALVVALVSLGSALQLEMTRILSELVAHHTAARILDVTESAPLTAFETPEFHDRLQRAEMGAGLRPFQITQSLLGIIGGLSSIIGMLIAVSLVQPLLLPLVFTSLVPALTVALAGSRAFYRYSVEMTSDDRRRSYLHHVMTSREGAKEVIAFGLSGVFREMWEGLYDSRLHRLRSIFRNRLGSVVLGSFATSFLGMAPIAVLAYLTVTAHIGIAQALSGGAALLILGSSLGRSMINATQLYESSLFLDDYRAFLKLKPLLTTSRHSAPAPPNFRRIRIHHASFTYPGMTRSTLKNISMEIGKGEVIALVGENGSGKTTLAKMLCGLYEPDDGCIRWDGQDIAYIDRDQLRRAVAPIFQDFGRYMLTVAQNIAIGDVSRLDDVIGVRRSAIRAGADSFITTLSDGYSTLLGRELDGGHEISIGQWQRIALARALFRDAPFIILDEPTSALDARSETNLFLSLRDLCKDRAVLLISHRFSTVRSADRIYVLKSGEIIEEGNHEALMKKDGLYAELFRLQGASYADDLQANTSLSAVRS